MAPTQKVSDVSAVVKRQFGDEAGVQVTDTDIMRWINMGQREILIQNPVNKAVQSTDVIKGQDTYDITTLGVLDISSIRINNFPIEYRSFNEAEDFIIKNDPNRANTGTPELWYSWAGKIILSPMPDATISNGMTIYYTKNFTPVVGTGDFLTVPDDYFNRLVEYVLAQAYELDEDSQNASYKMSQFSAGLANQANREDTPGNNLYPFITVTEDDWY
jgi:hypothetical protein